MSTSLLLLCVSAVAVVAFAVSALAYPALMLLRPRRLGLTPPEDVKLRILLARGNRGGGLAPTKFAELLDGEPYVTLVDNAIAEPVARIPKLPSWTGSSDAAFAPSLRTSILATTRSRGSHRELGCYPPMKSSTGSRSGVGRKRQRSGSISDRAKRSGGYSLAARAVRARSALRSPSRGRAEC